MELSEAQRKAIHHNTGPALILAGPGSGKTTVITHRIYNLIHEFGVNPSHILVITFTKAAAEEMKERFLRKSGNASAVAFGTFHAVYFTILKHSYHYRADCIISPDQQSSIIQELVVPYELENDDENQLIQDLLSEISHVKNGRIPLEEFQSKVCPENTFRKIYVDYGKMLKKKGLIDFDDMLIDCYTLLRNRPDILAAWQNKYRYILIDEFQDINQVQFDVIAMIASKYRNIFVVGDDDQSIYGFRGSKPEIMKEFVNIYKEAVMVELSNNYRCGANVVKNAKAVISHNENRFAKNIVSANAMTGQVEVHQVEKLEEEYAFIIRKMKELHEQGIAYDQMAVLSRLNSMGSILSGKMLLAEVPCIWKSQEKHIYDHWIAKDVIAYIQAAHGNFARENMLRIINKPMRYITRSYLTEPVRLEALKNNYTTDEEMIGRISDLQFDLKMIGKMTMFAAINYIRKAVGYDAYIETFARKHHMKLEPLMDVVEEITEQSKDYANAAKWLEFIDNYGKEVQEAKRQKNEGTGVHLLTMHSAKGLEFQVVFIVDFHDGMIPYHKAVLPNEMEEERRMFYVAMTRAKEYLYMVFAKERYNKKMTGSRFLSELEPQSCHIHLIEEKE